MARNETIPRNATGVPCAEDGCNRPTYAGCRCRPHYDAHRRSLEENSEEFRTRRKHRGASPLTTREQARLRTYGVTPARYAAILAMQGGACAMCETVEGALAVDHDHACCPGPKSCGKCVRGLLCRRCNLGLGLLRDSPGILMAGYKYLSDPYEVRYADSAWVRHAG